MSLEARFASADRSSHRLRAVAHFAPRDPVGKPHRWGKRVFRTENRAKRGQRRAPAGVLAPGDAFRSARLASPRHITQVMCSQTVVTLLNLVVDKKRVPYPLLLRTSPYLARY